MLPCILCGESASSFSGILCGNMHQGMHKDGRATCKWHEPAAVPHTLTARTRSKFLLLLATSITSWLPLTSCTLPLSRCRHGVSPTAVRKDTPTLCRDGVHQVLRVSQVDVLELVTFRGEACGCSTCSCFPSALYLCNAAVSPWLGRRPSDRSWTCGHPCPMTTIRHAHGSVLRLTWFDFKRATSKPRKASQLP